MNNSPTINFSQVPQHVKDDIGAATLAAVKEFLMQPGGKEFLEKKISEKKKGAKK